MIRIIQVLIGALVMGATVQAHAPVASEPVHTVVEYATPATATVASASYDQPPFAPYRFGSHSVCLETNGWKFWPYEAVAERLNASPDLYVVARASCAGWGTNRTVKLRLYNDPSDYACGKTAVSYQNGIVLSAVTYMNMASRWYGQCHATAAQRAHMASHEATHPIGLAHCTTACSSVMGSWAYSWSTDRDLWRISQRYPW